MMKNKNEIDAAVEIRVSIQLVTLPEKIVEYYCILSVITRIFRAIKTGRKCDRDARESQRETWKKY